MKREYKINSTSEVLVTNQHQENHNTTAVILWPDAKPKY